MRMPRTHHKDSGQFSHPHPHHPPFLPPLFPPPLLPLSTPPPPFLPVVSCLSMRQHSSTTLGKLWTNNIRLNFTPGTVRMIFTNPIALIPSGSACRRCFCKLHICGRVVFCIFSAREEEQFSDFYGSLETVKTEMSKQNMRVLAYIQNGLKSLSLQSFAKYLYIPHSLCVSSILSQRPNRVNRYLKRLTET